MSDPILTGKIVELFTIAGRGVVAVVDAASDLPVNKVLCATVTPSQSEALQFQAHKEWLRRTSDAPLETESFLLMGATQAQLHIGAAISISV